MSARTVDVLIFIPLLPTAFLFLPWELWIPSKIAKKVIGPYLLYCAFAIWHFRQPLWAVFVAGVMGIATCVWVIFDLRKARLLKQAQERNARMLEQARDWPIAKGFVLYAGRSRGVDGVLKLSVSYLYKVQDQEFVGAESFLFRSEGDAERLESRCREQRLKVHYLPENPEICRLDRDGMQ